MSSLTDPLDDVPEPWRTTRLRLRGDCARIMAGWVPPDPETVSRWVVAGQRMADIRRAKGFTQETLAQKTGYSRATINGAERGCYGTRPGSGPGSQTQRDIAQALGVAVEDIWR